MPFQQILTGFTEFRKDQEEHSVAFEEIAETADQPERAK